MRNMYDFTGGEPVTKNDTKVNNPLDLIAALSMMNVIPNEDVAYAYNGALGYEERVPGFGRAVLDAWHLMYNNMQKAEIDESDDVIRKAAFDAEDASIIKDYLNNQQISDDEFYNTYGVSRDDQNTAAMVNERLERLKRDGVWTDKEIPGIEDLQEIIDNANEKREEAIENKRIDEEQLQSSLDNYDISQYATRKSNEAGYSLGNFLYKTASTFGSSWADIGHQMTSTLAGLAVSVGTDAAIGAYIGGAAGSVAPGAGTAAGAVAGGTAGAIKGFFKFAATKLAAGLAGTAAAQFGGGIAAREGESHMEAYTQYKDNLDRIVNEDGIDTKKVIDNVKSELAKQGRDTNITDEQALDLAASGEIKSGSNQYDDAARRAFRGTRKLYEKNMALGAGEVATDMLFYVPMFRNSKVFTGVLNPMKGAVDLAKGTKNTILSLLSKRAAANAAIAKEALDTTVKAGKKLTGKELSKNVWKKELGQLGAAKLVDMYEEGTEEGAQYIAAKEAAAGEYDDLLASETFWDSVKNGNLFDNLAQNWVNRQRSTIAAFTPFDPVYSNDKELFENYVSGAMMSVLDPRSAAMIGKEALIDIRKLAKASKLFGDIFARALEEQDFVDRSADLLQSVRQLGKSGRNYDLVLDNIAEALKSGKYDVGAISDPDQGDATPEQIDEYIKEEKDNYHTLVAVLQLLSPRAAAMGLSERESDIFAAIGNNVILKRNEAAKTFDANNKKLIAKFKEETSDESVASLNIERQLMNAIGGTGQTYTDEEVAYMSGMIKDLTDINSRLNKAVEFSQRLSNQTYAQSLLKLRGITAVENALQMLDLQRSSDLAVAQLRIAKQQLLTQLATKLTSFNTINQLIEKLDAGENESNRLALELEDLKNSLNTISPLDNIGHRTDRIHNDITRTEAAIERQKLSNEDLNKRIASEQDTLNNIINQLSEQTIANAELSQLYDETIASQIELNAIDELYKVFSGKITQENTKKAKNLILKFQNRVKTQAAERDAANDKAQGKPTETTEEIKAKTDEELNAQLETANDAIVNILSDAVAIEPSFKKVIDRLNAGISTMRNATQKVNYTKHTLDKFKKTLENMPKDGMSEEEKQVYSGLITKVDAAYNLVTEINNRAYDKAFNAKRHALRVNSDVNEWVASDGKKYQFLTGDMEFSINEGLILTAKDVTDTTEIDDLKKQAAELDKQRNQLKSKLSKEGETLSESEIKDINNKIIETTNHINNILADIDIKSANKTVKFNAKENEEYLRGLKRVDNTNKEHLFSNKLDNYLKQMNKNIETLNKNKQYPTDEYYNGDLNDELNGTTNLKPDWIEQKQNESDKKNHTFKAHGYTVNTPAGHKFANRLREPYYQAKMWRGTIEVKQWDDVKDNDFYRESGGKGDDKWNRGHALKTFADFAKYVSGKSADEIFTLFTLAKQGKLPKGASKDTLTKSRILNMINALPVGATLYHPRLFLNYDGIRKLIPTRIVFPDISSKNLNGKMYEYDVQLRENMILNLLNNKQDGKSAKLNVPEGKISIYYSQFLLNTKNEPLITNPLLLDENGEALKGHALNERYDNHLQSENILEKVSAHIDEINEFLNSHGYDSIGINDTVTVTENKEKYQYNTLAYLLRGISKLGDDVIQYSALMNYLKNIFDKSKNKSKTDKTQKEFAEAFVDLITSIAPETFMSYSAEGGLSLNTQAAVENTLTNHWVIKMPIKMNGKQIILNPQTKSDVINLCEQIESEIKNQNTKKDFIDALHDRGFTFGNEARIVLQKYFTNRKFTRLLDPSNIIQVLTSNNDVPPDNHKIETRVNVVQLGSIEDVAALGVIYDELTGQLHYSKDKYKQYLLERQKEQVEDTDANEEIPGLNDIEEGAENARNLVKGNGKIANKIKAIEEAYSTTYEEIAKAYNAEEQNFAKIRVEKDGSYSRSLSNPIREALLWYIDTQEQQQLDKLYKEFEDEMLLETQSVEDAVESEFSGKDHEPITIGYGTADGTIRFFDPYTKKMSPRKGAKGKAGAVYLLLPSFLNPNRDRLPIKLNTKQIDLAVAKVIANLMYKVASGQISKDQSISSDMAPGLTVYDSVSVESFLRSLMFYGTDAIERDPSMANMNRLVDIRNGKVYYGNSIDGNGMEVTEDTIDDFAKWISETKNYRIDRDMLEGDAITLHGSYEIKDEDGKVILSQEDGENYVTHIIRKQLIRTDMDPSKNSTIFGGAPLVYLEYTDNFKGFSEDDVKEVKTKPKGKKSVSEKEASNAARNYNANQEKVAIPKLVSDVRLTLIEYASLSEDMLAVEIDGKRNNIRFFDNGDLADDYASTFEKKLVNYLRRHKKATINIVSDDEVVETLIYSDGVSDTATPSDEIKSTKSSKQAETKETTTDDSNNDIDLSKLPKGLQKLLKDVDDLDEAYQIIKTYFHENKEKEGLKKGFISEAIGIWSGGPDSNDGISHAASDDLDADNAGKGAQGATPALKKKHKETLLIDNLGNAEPVVEDAKSTPKDDSVKFRPVEEMLETIQEDSILYLMSKAKGWNNDASPEDKKTILKETYVDLVNEVFKDDLDKVMELFGNVNAINEQLKKHDLRNAKLLDSVSRFLNSFIRTEDYDAALARVRKMLGDDFDFDVYSDLPFEYDHNEKAMMYVYGVTTSNGIRLFRDAKTNRVRRGTAYHEAFHRISTLLMSKIERERMYKVAEKINPKLIGATEIQKQEYLADMFAKWVLHQISNENKLYRFLNKIGTKVKELINRLRGRMEKMDNEHKMHKLFTDMYTGKYAYMEATKENKDYFELAFGYDPLYNSFKYKGVEIADSAELFNDIYRNILAKTIENANLNVSTDGTVRIDYDDVFDYYKEEQKNANNYVKSMHAAGDIKALVKALQYKKIIDGIVANKNLWKQYIKRQVRMNFSIDQINDPNLLDYSDVITISEDGVEKNLSANEVADKFSQFVAEHILESYRRNQYKAMDADVKLIFYTITDVDYSKADSTTEDGLKKYTDVFQLWHELCHNCQECESIEDVIAVAKRLSIILKKEGKPNTMRQVAEILESPETSELLKHKIFVNITKYINDFVSFNYRIQDKDKGGLDVSIEDSNSAKSQKNASKSWQNKMRQKLISLKTSFADKKDNYIRLYFTKGDSHLQLFTDNKGDFSKDLQLFLNKLDIEVSTEDVDKYINKLNDTEFKNLLISIRNVRNNITGCLASKDADKSDPNKLVDELFNFNGKNIPILVTLADLIGTSELGSAKNDTVRIAGGAVAYIISQFNHVTRFFKRYIKNKELIKRFENNPYTMEYGSSKSNRYYGSQWLRYLSKKPVNLKTLVATVSDSNYNDSNDFMNISSIEDMLNKFSTAMSNYHAIPELANKKIQYLINGTSDIPMIENPVALMGGSYFTVNEAAIKVFQGYILSEMRTIRQACADRLKFVDKISKITGVKRTYQDISKMSQEEQEKLFKDARIAPLLGELRLFYHYTKKSGLPIKNADGTFTRRSFGIDLMNPKKCNGYKSRHFGALVDSFGVNENTTDREMFQFVMKSEVVDFIKHDLIFWNMRQVLQFMLNKGIIEGYDPEKQFGAQEIKNKNLPENAIKNKFNIKGTLSSNDIIKAVGYFVVNNMSDNIEFEKMVSGDIAEYKDMDGVNKRYSAQTSTVSIAPKNSDYQDPFFEDELYDSPTYRTVEMNTTIIDNLDKFKHEAKMFLGVDAFDEELNTAECLDGETDKKSGAPKHNCLNYRKLLDRDGNLLPAAKRGILTNIYLQHRDEFRTYGVDKNGKQLSDELLAKEVTDNCYIRLIGYRNVDPTDAQTWITADMYKRLCVDLGEWSDVKEACHNLLEHYDEIDVMEVNNKIAFDLLLNTLSINPEELKSNFDAYKAGKMSEENYAGYILGHTKPLIQGSLKYVFFGPTDGDEKTMISHLYDKTSLSPIYKIFAKNHDMIKIYNLMKETHTHMMKMESCTKTGNLPSFELYKADGTVDEEAFKNAPRQDQSFEHLGKQLNTDPHEHTTATLLTQFMKIAVMNIVPTNHYRINGTNLSGKLVLEKYQDILDSLTNNGFKVFCEDFGINPETFEVNKAKFMNKLLDMATTLGVTSEMLDALSVDENGNFVIHPSALPNINWIQSRLVSAMDKTIIKTVTPGKPLFQVASAGYDNILKAEKSADKTLKSYNEDGFMEVKLSISLFKDVLKSVEVGDGETMWDRPYNEQRLFLLDNQDILFGTSYRVPTQGQNSTIPIKIVDVFESQRGDIIMFPSDITALTGSDFDIDKMFLATYNVEIIDGKARRIECDFSNLDKLIADLNSSDANVADHANKALQNGLLDIYLTILTNAKHRVDAVTPLDVTTEPLKKIKNEIEAIKGKSKDERIKHPGWYLNPLFQVEQRSKNAGSSNGIGPMALNNVFRFFIQMSGLDMRKNSYLQSLNLSIKDNGKPRIFDRNGENILDSTSALINAHVDAVKDNYIGRMNVNEYTFDVVSALISNGMGNDTYWFLGQQILCDVAENYIDIKNGQVGVDEERQAGLKFLYEIRDKYAKMVDTNKYDLNAKATPEEMATASMRDNIAPKGTEEWYAQQIRYLNTFLYIKDIAQSYRKALTCALIDTGKYGINANDIINFMLSHDQFISKYNVVFGNPNDLFDKTFLGEKYNKGVAALFDIFSQVLLEFSRGYVSTINHVAKQLGIYGPFGKQQMARFGLRLKTAILARFFNQYAIAKYQTNTPLVEMLTGNNTVVDRLESIKEIASYTNEGKALLDVLKPSMTYTGQPKFFIIDSSVQDDVDVRSNVSQAWQELYESEDEQLSQYAVDLAVYMFYVTGGTDSNASGLTKTSIFDLVPPKLLANLKVGGITYNQYITNMMETLSNGNVLNESYIKVARDLTALFDDKFAKIIRPGKVFSIESLFGTKRDVVVIKKGSDKLYDYNTGLYRPYIKILDENGFFTTYKLGDIQFTKSGGKKYINPVYYKMPKVGYRNKKLPMYAVRADGIVNGEGHVQSLLYGNFEMPMNSSEIDFDGNKEFERLASTMLTVHDSLDFSLVYDEHFKNNYTYTGYNLPYADFAAIDDADVVIYIDDGTANVQLLVDYAQYKEKEFIVYTEDMAKSKLQELRGKNVTIIGSAEPVYNKKDEIIKDMLKELIDKLPNSVYYVASAEHNTVGSRVMSMINNGDLLGKLFISYEMNPKWNKGNFRQAVHHWTRAEVKHNSRTLYIFTDNTDRTSNKTGDESNQYGEGWYKTKYGKGGFGSETNPTSAIIRGLDNAAPISTMKWFYNVKTEDHEELKNASSARWKDSDLDYFKEVIDDEIEQIKRMWDTGNFDRIEIPEGSDAFFGGDISGIDEKSKIGKHLDKKLNELYDYVNGSDSNESVNENDKDFDDTAKKHCNKK